ncbi:MAG: ArnT family glycosyltransferase [Candidatus Eiseniibacteriota bacterium]
MRFLLAAVVLAGVVLRIVFLENVPGLSGDEAWYGVRALERSPLSVTALETPTGRTASPAWFAPVWLLQQVFGPSVLALRGLAVVSGLAAVALIGWLVRSAFGTRCGVVAAMLAASLPPFVAYSRIGWEPALIPLATAALLYFAFRGRVGPVLVVTAAGLLAHPVVGFALPIAALLFVRDRVPRGGRGVAVLAGLAAGIVALSLALLVALPLPETYDPERSFPQAFSWRAVRLFAFGYARLLGGPSVYEHFAGSWMPAAAEQTLVATVLAASIAARLVGIRRFPALVLGEAAALLVFYFVAGPGAFSPEYERYALWTVVPAVVVVSAALGSLRASVPATALACAALCAHFALAYPVHVLRNGGEAHRTYRTAAVDPKRAAADALRARAEASGPRPPVIVEDYWLEWPLRYYLGRDAPFEFLNPEREGMPAPEFAARMREGASLVVWDGGRLHGMLLAHFGGRLPPAALTFEDASGRPVLHAFVVE